MWNSGLHTTEKGPPSFKQQLSIFHLFEFSGKYFLPEISAQTTGCPHQSLYNTYQWPSSFMHKIHISGPLSLGHTIHKTGPLSLCISGPLSLGHTIYKTGPLSLCMHYISVASLYACNTRQWPSLFMHTIYIRGPLSVCMQYTSVALSLYACNTHQ
jgi:hypothetical protein